MRVFASVLAFLWMAVSPLAAAEQRIAVLELLDEGAGLSPAEVAALTDDVRAAVYRFSGDLEARLKLFDTASGSLLGQAKAGGADLKQLREDLDGEAKRLFGLVERSSPSGLAVGGGQVRHGVAPLDRGEQIVNEMTDDKGYLIVESEPSGATFYLNGKEIGTTPKQIEQMVGRYVLTADLGKLYRPARQEVDLTTSGAEVKLTLTPAFGRLEVTSEPAGAEVYLDGEPVGTTPWTAERKPSGTYELRLVKAHHLTHKGQVQGADGQTTRERVTLRPNWGTLEVTSEPAGAAIELNGRATGQVTPQTYQPLEPGTYTVKLTLEGYGEVTERATVAKGGRAQIAPALQAKLGLLTVLASYEDGTPCRGKLYIDGQEQGQTPAKLEVTAREHDVKVVCPKGERAERVTVRHNERTSLDWKIVDRAARRGGLPVPPVPSGVEGSRVEGHPSAGAGGTMRDNGDGTVTDLGSGLVWEKKPSAENLNWSKAKAHCAGKGSGWRLPTISELRSLIRGCPATQTKGSCNVADGGCLAWGCRDSSCSGCSSERGPGQGGYYQDPIMENSGNYWFWSSSPLADRSRYAWLVYFDNGYVYDSHVNNDFGVRCVRPGP